jgi:glycosyltransferase involved in cell wall biosynthesis
MKILFLIRSLERGGAERQLAGLARGLWERGHEIVVAVFYEGGALEADLAGTGVALRSLAKRGRWDIPAFLGRLVRLVRCERPDVLYGFLVDSNVMAAAIKPLFPGLKVVWGVRASNMDLSRYDWLAKVMFRLGARLSRFADLIVFNSAAGMRFHQEKGYPKEKSIVVANGTDVERFRPDTEARTRIREEWGVSRGQTLVGIVGRLDPMKDHPTFLRAAVLLAGEREDIVFAVVGGGPAEYRQTLQALSCELKLDGRVVWAGEKEDMPGVYNALDVAVSSSAFGEGTPNAVAEAMACGVPCVVTDVGDSAVLVGEKGIVVRPGDPAGLADGIKTALARVNVDGTRLRENVRRRIEAEFSMGSLIERTHAVLSALVPERPSTGSMRVPGGLG